MNIKPSTSIHYIPYLLNDFDSLIVVMSAGIYVHTNKFILETPRMMDYRII